MRSVISYITILSFIASGVFSPLFAAESARSKYTGKIDVCIKANKEGRAKTIEDYVCPVGTLSPQQIAFQVVMSIEFKKLDNEVKKDLQKIHKETNKDIGQLSSNIRDLFDRSNKKSVYPAKYEEICNTLVMNETILYFKEKGESSKMSDGVTTDNDANNFIFGQEGCSRLVDKKLQAYKESAWLLGESAVVTSFKNDKHTYMRKLKDQYEKFLNKWTIYIGQLGVIKDKWPSKTKVVQ
ncbi:MAG: hypothetical protein PHN60_03000 [Candidatus Gracilibacteria bacterium]|nr:hypothetical protein [Candidatus Gracilibacteria bacterium]